MLKIRSVTRNPGGKKLAGARGRNLSRKLSRDPSRSLSRNLLPPQVASRDQARAAAEAQQRTAATGAELQALKAATDERLLSSGVRVCPPLTPPPPPYYTRIIRSALLDPVSDARSAFALA